MDISVMGSSMQYLSNTTTAYKDGAYYIKSVSAIPYTGSEVVTEEFITAIGNYSCTNALSRPVCVINNESSIPIVNDLVVDNYSTATYLGSKQLINRYCDAVLVEANLSSIMELEDIDTDLLSGITSASTYSCVDPMTGISLESLSSIAGESYYGTMLVDVSINLTKSVSSITLEVPDSTFTIPYEVVSAYEYEQLLNESLSQSL